MNNIEDVILPTIKPIESPLGTGAYDFETCLIEYRGSFLKIGGQPAADIFTFAALSVPYYLHACTNFGRFNANIRSYRDLAFKSASQRIDYDSLWQIEKNKISKDISILSEDLPISGQQFPGNDPLTPNAQFHLRGHWRAYLHQYFSIYDTYQRNQFDLSEFVEQEAQGYLLSELQGKKLWMAQGRTCNHIYSDSDNLIPTYYRKPKPKVCYHGKQYEPISVKLMIQCYWGLSEIILKHHVDPNGSRSRLAKFCRHECYSVAKMILFALNVLQNQYNVTMLAPTLLYIIEFALNGPLPGSRDYSQDVYDQEQLDPPMRLYKICKSLPKDYPVLTSQGIDPKQVSEFFSKMKKIIPLEYYLDMSTLSFPNIENSILQLLDSDSVREFDWQRWYLSLSCYSSSKIIKSYGSVTEYLMNFISDDHRHVLDIDIELAPMLIDSDACVSAFSVFSSRLNGQVEGSLRMRAFLATQVESYTRTSFMTRRGGEPLTFLPFLVPDDILFNRWLDIDKNEYIRSYLFWLFPTLV